MFRTEIDESMEEGQNTLNRPAFERYERKTSLQKPRKRRHQSSEGTLRQHISMAKFNSSPLPISLCIPTKLTGNM